MGASSALLLYFASAAVNVPTFAPARSEVKRRGRSRSCARHIFPGTPRGYTDVTIHNPMLAELHGDKVGGYHSRSAMCLFY